MQWLSCPVAFVWFVPKVKILFCPEINTLLTKLVQSRCLSIGHVLLLCYYGPRHCLSPWDWKVELGQFPVILNLRLVNRNNAYINTEMSETCLQSLNMMSCLLNVCFLFYCYEILVPLIQQRAKKVVSDSPGLVDFAIGLVNSVVNLPNGQVKIF